MPTTQSITPIFCFISALLLGGGACAFLKNLDTRRDALSLASLFLTTGAALAQTTTQHQKKKPFTTLPDSPIKND